MSQLDEIVDKSERERVSFPHTLLNLNLISSNCNVAAFPNSQRDCKICIKWMNELIRDFLSSSRFGLSTTVRWLLCDRCNSGVSVARAICGGWSLIEFSKNHFCYCWWESKVDDSHVATIRNRIWRSEIVGRVEEKQDKQCNFWILTRSLNQ